jgi:hypothetical protein
MFDSGRDRDVSVLLGQTLTNIDVVTEDGERTELLFTTSAGQRYRMYHVQDCCENVYLYDVCGELDDLIGSPLLMAEEVSSANEPPIIREWGEPDSFTWTFYKFATIDGYVTLRWFGESNGYYSEEVTFELIPPKREDGGSEQEGA